MYRGVIYWDACIFYEWLGKEDVPREKSDGVNEVLDVNDEGNNTIITSVATHLEVLPQKLDEKDDEAEAKYLSLFDAEKFCEIQINTNVILLPVRLETTTISHSCRAALEPKQNLQKTVHLLFRPFLR